MIKTKHTPFFSVIIPVYNKGPHIKRSISSVLKQTFQDFELLLINDASTDNSLEEMQKYTDHRIRIFHRYEPGPGGYAARNLGIKEARAEWVAFLDADDEWMPEHLEKMHDLAQKYPDVHFMSCGWQTQNKNKKRDDPFYKKFNANATLKINVEEYLKFALKYKAPVRTSVICIKKASPIALNLFPADLGAKRGGDLHAWLKLICYHKKMSWSNHLGAIYHIDSVNMVTKNAKSSTHLMRKNIYAQLSKDLSQRERVLLKKYLNFRLINMLVGSKIKKQRYWSILKNLYWRDDFFNSLKALFFGVLPLNVIHLKVRLFKTKIK